MVSKPLAQACHKSAQVLYEKYSAQLLSYNGEKYADHPNSVNNHYYTTLGDIENKILAVGDNVHNKVELFDINSNKWTTKTSFPFAST